MEFKSQEKWRVQDKFSISEEQLDLAIRRMIKRHPLENWISERITPNGETVVYLKLEFINWLEEVYFNRSKFYLDADIEFFEKQITRLEGELNFPHKEIEYQDMTIRQLCDYFNKNINAIYMAVNRWRKANPMPKKFLEDGRLLIPAEGVKWLSKNYFRKSYLKKLELYKLELQKNKRDLYEQSSY